MPKVKIPRKSTSIDMTAMCDVAFLLLTFFMLTTKFKPDDPVQVDIPASISEVTIPEKDILQITIDKQNKVYFGVDGQGARQGMLEKMGQRYNVTFTPQEEHTFMLISSFGVPIHQMKQFLDLTGPERDKINQPGIPIDSVNGELGDWVLFARRSDPGLRITIKGDQDASFPTAKRVFDILQKEKINTFNFITSLKKAPDIK